MCKDYNVNQLVSLLPIHLKAETFFYVYQEAISIIKVLQNKD